VILLGLRGVVVDELLDGGLDELDFGQDLVGGGGPDKRLGVGVPMVDVVADLGDEYLDRGERAAADSPAGDDGEPGPDLVDPDGSDRTVVPRRSPPDTPSYRNLRRGRRGCAAVLT